jgi:hypothetical protein
MMSVAELFESKYNEHYICKTDNKFVLVVEASHSMFF